MNSHTLLTEEGPPDDTEPELVMLNPHAETASMLIYKNIWKADEVRLLGRSPPTQVDEQ